MTQREIVRFLILRTVGNFLVLFALFGVFATFGQAVAQEIRFRKEQVQGITYLVKEAPSSQRFSGILSKEKIKILVPKNTDFGILIPKIGANETVIANVDPAIEEEFQLALKKGVAHAKGTVFPGMNGTIYLFAHSTDNFWEVGRYNAVFYLIKELKENDEVVLFFEGKRFNYRVVESKIVEASDVSYLVNSQKTGEELLILQTCWPPGTTWKRLMVFAKPTKST
ncbi:MAG: hypothetical protein A3J69_00025 [Candidatus Levybacteria bacterium RIFCSPHIGHO2_02_FULL_42_12]|nr:MAG: hypothetical protein A3J69_00025 [Candidatus Levybacteria bacterium RIFCSPHIGHO2_02_FULL_42_12]OGH43047.1 MAG: hypothetical protein A3B53_00710 [Candidatus Levybacteria bacterium RIFCSPLOWO2_01_FULL_42_15]